MKRTIKLYLILGFTLLLPMIGFGQIEDEEQIGGIVFKESLYYVVIARDVYDKAHVYYEHKVNDITFVMESLQIDRGSGESIDFEFLPFKFIRRNDTIWFALFNPLSALFNPLSALFNPLDGLMELQPAYPLKVGDTIRYSGCHLNMLDSVEQKDGTYIVKLFSCDDKNRDDMTVYSGDTTVTILGWKMNCHIFTQFDNFTTSPTKGSYTKRTILFSIKLMIPVEIVNYYYEGDVKAMNAVPKHQWLESSRTEAIKWW